MIKDKILVVDDEPEIRRMLLDALRGWGYETAEAETAAAALTVFDAEQPAAVLLDISFPNGSGLDVLRQIKHRQPHAVVIMITADMRIENAISALRGGAYDFIAKPINPEELRYIIRNGIEARHLREKVNLLRDERSREFSFDLIIGRSPSMTNMIAMARKVAESEASSVLLQGESGTGKDLVAKAIHHSSRRADAPFISINCAAIPATLIESELFGYEKGAFTDARARKPGLFEQAQKGTLFLDEIGELELGLQAKLLRVLEEGMFRRVGGLKDIPLDVRVIAASNRDLKAESETGRFRLDLYYRLSVVQIDLPPLRERGDDVLKLAEHLIAHFNQQMGKRVRGLQPEVMEIFRRYAWPGNVRELRNVVERAMILEESDLITTAYLPHDVAPGEKSGRGAPPLPRRAGEVDEAANEGLAVIFGLPSGGIELDAVELSLVEQAVARTGGNRTRAAELLGISRDRLRYRLKKITASH
jgi:DNA-binding NtrC family response regulator